MRRTSRPAVAESIWTDAREVPVAGVTTPSKLDRRARRLRFAVKTSVVLLPLTLVALILVLGARARPASTPAEPPAPTSSQGRSVATIALQAWLDHDPGPLPGGSIVSWDGADADPPPSSAVTVTGQVATFPTERDRFTVVDGSGALYRAEVLVALDPAGGASVLAGPSLTPVPDARPAGVGNEYQAWGALTTVTAPPAVESAVRAWAKTYTSGDPAALRLTVGDRNPDHAYLPMTAPQATTVSVRQGAFLPSDDPGTAPTRMVVRVRLMLDYHPATQPAGAEQKTPPPTVFDVLVDEADTAAPNVVAWGGAGSGPTLTAYQNAVPADAPTGQSAPATAPSSAPPAAPGSTAADPRPSTTPQPSAG